MAAPFRRVRPGDPGWPTAPEWDKLRAQVDGNLLRPDGLYSMCATDAAASGCTGALKEIGNPFFLGDQAGGTQTSGWLNAWSPKPSAYAVAARKPEDVVAAVNFARDAPAASGGERRRPLLSGHFQRAGFASGLDPRHARHHLA